MKTFVIGDIHGRRGQMNALLDLMPRDESVDTLVFLGDLIDRGDDAPGVVADVLALKAINPDRVITIRGNHEQMLLDCIDEGAGLWFTPAAGGEFTYHQYTGTYLEIDSVADLTAARDRISRAVPAEHVEFFRSMPYFHEDEYALYVHAGLLPDKHPRDTHPRVLLWTRDVEFYRNYHGKPCIFGHTPTPYLPLMGRIGRHGIYIANSAVGIDTGYNDQSPLSCLQLPEFQLYQAFADGRTTTHHITMFVPDSLRAMHQASGA
ncbi:MAG: metallophosphoesterase family protein [Pyrinomonadaceae bacterium]